MSAVTIPPSFPSSGAALIASPSSALRERILHRLNGRCRPVQQALGGAEALAKLEKGAWQVLFLDRRLPDLDVEEVIAIIQKRFPGIRVVLLDSDRSDLTTIEDARQDGVGGRDWPLSESSSLSNRGSTGPMVESLPGMIGVSTAMQHVYRMVHLVAARSTTVLITGSTGTGKELVARALHALSPRANKPFVAVNCAAIPEALLESELFGYSRGAFTGAVQSQLGRISSAHGGTLFLDEISEMPMGMQAKLLRFLEQREVQRLGTCEITRVDVRVLAASNADLADRVMRGVFRQDLFYRLSAFPVELPPLSQRRGDVIPLAEHFLNCMAAALQMPVPHLGEEAAKLLEAYPWPGNVRELQHVMERASILVENGNTIEASHLFFSGPQSQGLRSFAQS